MVPSPSLEEEDEIAAAGVSEAVGCELTRNVGASIKDDGSRDDEEILVGEDAEADVWRTFVAAAADIIDVEERAA